MKNRFNSREVLCDGIGFNPAGGSGSVSNVKGAGPSVRLNSTSEAAAMEAMKAIQGFDAVSQKLKPGTFALFGAASFVKPGSIG